METKKEPRLKEVPLSESTISPSLSAIRKRCKDLFDTNTFIDFGIEDRNGKQKKLAAGAYNPYDHAS